MQSGIQITGSCAGSEPGDMKATTQIVNTNLIGSQVRPNRIHFSSRCLGTFIQEQIVD